MLSVRRLRILALLPALAVASPARAEVVARQRAATTVAAHGDYAAWSRYEGPRRFRLVIWQDGKARRAKVEPRGAAFDVDLGTDARGRVVAVYSRCARYNRQQPLDWLPVHAFDDRCDLYAYDLEARRERRLERPRTRTASEFLPAIDRGRLVFARNRPVRGRSPRVPGLVSARLSPYREQLLPRPRWRPYDAVDDRNLGPSSIDADGGLAVVGWNHVVPRDSPCGGDYGLTTVYQILLYDLATRSRRTLEDDCVRATSPDIFFGSPSLSAGAVFYTYSPIDTDDDAPLSGVRRFDLTTGAHRDTPPAPHYVLSSQTSGGWTWTVNDVVIDRVHSIEVARSRVT